MAAFSLKRLYILLVSEKSSSVTKHILQKIEENSARHENIVWTYNMRQLAVLVAKALEFKEPVLLVGETGGGKTTVCKLIADNNGQELVTINCHMHTESGDFIGGLRPVRDHSVSFMYDFLKAIFNVHVYVFRVMILISYLNGLMDLFYMQWLMDTYFWPMKYLLQMTVYWRD